MNKVNKENAFDYCSILDEYYSILLWLSMTFYGVIVIETNVRAHLHAHTHTHAIIISTVKCRGDSRYNIM